MITTSELRFIGFYANASCKLGILQATWDPRTGLLKPRKAGRTNGRQIPWLWLANAFVLLASCLVLAYITIKIKILKELSKQSEDDYRGMISLSRTLVILYGAHIINSCCLTAHSDQLTTLLNQLLVYSRKIPEAALMKRRRSQIFHVSSACSCSIALLGHWQLSSWNFTPCGV